MDNLWILTEERPKVSVVCKIIEIYKKDFGGTVTFHDKIQIKANFKNKCFQFSYTVEGIDIQGINQIILKIVSGNSSFLDFLVFLKVVLFVTCYLLLNYVLIA